jgi:hypothetical protein
MVVGRATCAAALVGLIVLIAGGCGPGPSPSVEPSAGSIVRFEQAEIADGGSVLTLHFVGGPPYDPNDPCSNAYSGWARLDGADLDAAVVDRTPPSTGACSLVGFGRTVSVALARPFLGSRVHDLAGGTHFVRRPDDALQIHGLPTGWTLQSEADGDVGADGQWVQTFSPAPLTLDGTTLHKLALYQTFGEPSTVSIGGPDEGVHVTVNGTSATLHGPVADGELLLTWDFGSNGLTFDANSADFSPAELIALAESAAAP